MNFSIEKIIRPHILTLTPYASARDEYSGKEGVFLDANENPYGSVVSENYNRYPDPHQAAIKQKLAPIKGVRPTQIFLGNGSDEPIDLLIRATCTPRQDSILIMPPTYGMYQVSADVNDVAVIKVPLTPDFQIDTDVVLTAITPHTKIIWICSPNNPTGNLLQKDAVIRLIENFNGLVVVDEAYIDFVTPNPSEGLKPSERFLSELDNYPNLVVLQTLSKAWGLAALRLGMCFASEGLIALLNKIKSPYNLSSPVQKLVLEALDNVEQKNEMVVQILKQREALQENLSQLSIVRHIYPTDSNSLLVKFEDVAATMRHLIDQKIIVRDRSKVILCEGCLRISIGTAEENEQLLMALKQLSGS